MGAKVNLWMVLGEAAVGPARRCRWRSRCRGIDCHGVPYNSAYTASKHGLVGLTKSLALEFANDGVRVNAVCPTGVRTSMVSAPPPESIDWRAVARSAPWLDNSELCDPEDIADTVAFLASSEARRITGVALPVDGGQTAG